MSLLPFCEWLANTPWSISLHESEHAYAIIESVHVWTLCLFVGLAAMLDLRLLGMLMPRVPVSQMAQRLLPWTIAGFVVMVTTGSLLFTAIPVRTYQNVFFRFKLVLLVLAGINVFVFHNGIYRTIQAWDLDPVPPRSARLAGLSSLVLWALIIVAGRLIAYNWFDCDSATSTFVRTLSGCYPVEF
jgi:hypothetical protein